MFHCLHLFPNFACLLFAACQVLNTAAAGNRVEGGETESYSKLIKRPQSKVLEVRNIPSWWYRCRGLQSWLLLLHSAPWNTAMHSYQAHTETKRVFRHNLKQYGLALSWITFKRLDASLNHLPILIFLKSENDVDFVVAVCPMQSCDSVKMNCLQAYFVMTCNRWSVSTASRTFSGYW